jgi:hypothetical protein
MAGRGWRAASTQCHPLGEMSSSATRDVDTALLVLRGGAATLCCLFFVQLPQCRPARQAPHLQVVLKEMPTGTLCWLLCSVQM